MITALWTGRSGMNANQNKLDAISNNIANVSTNGYKKVDVNFQDLVQRTLDRNGIPLVDETSSTGTGVKTAEWKKDFSQGNLLETMRGTDIALDGQGFFRLTMPDGSDVYTRNGSFSIDSMGRMVDNSGNKLYMNYMPGYSEENVQFKANEILISKDGSVYKKEGEAFAKVAEIPVYTAIGDNAFLAVGNSLFLPSTDVQVYQTNNVDMIQGYLEGSNVDLSSEFTDMIVAQRAFQASSKGITTADEMWGMINSMRSR